MKSEPRLGLRANSRQFWLLVLINAFVGAMIGLERDLLPRLGEEVYGVASRTALLSFVAAFGAVKAASNYFAGRWGDRFGRRQILIVGWLFAVPVPFLLVAAPTWGWIVFANVLLGVSQGLAWSTLVIMKIDLVGSRQRGLAMGLNEFAGYLAVALATLAAGAVAARYGIHPQPFYLGFAFVAAGLGLSLAFARETRAHALMDLRRPAAAVAPPLVPRERRSAIAACNQAGLVNNLNDGLAWGLFPLLFATAGLSGAQIAILAASYPATWALLQLGTGALSDRTGRKPLIVGGMLLQAGALGVVAAAGDFHTWLAAAVLLGAGTAMVYPTLLAAVADVAPAEARGAAVGMYRLWRDSGYVAGALLAGIIADRLGIPAAVIAVAIITFGSGVWTARMPETLRAEHLPPASGGAPDRPAIGTRERLRA